MTDHWDFYFCEVDHRVASIFVDLGIVEEVPMSDHSTLAWLRLHMREPREDGLSSHEEFEQLREIGQKVVERVCISRSSHHVGNVTSNGTRDFFFYVVDGPSAEVRIADGMKAFPEYMFESGHHQDAEWKGYLDFLYPTPRDAQFIQNHHLVEMLEARGDRLETPRVVDHRLSLPSAEAREKLKATLALEGYGASEESEEEGGYWVSLSRSDPVVFEHIHGASMEVYDLVQEAGGTYDGWGCEILVGEDG